MTPALAIFFVLVFFVGASTGSFLNVCLARWPAGESVVRPRSRCPRCGGGIAWYDNVPVLSWIVLRAKCRGCGEPISASYPVIEASIGALWVACVWTFAAPFVAVRVAVLATILTGIAVTDAKHYIIPDGFTVSGLVFVGATSVAGALVGVQGPFAAPAEALFGACVGAGAITIIGWLGEVALRKEAMGFGDTTLMAVVGAALGPGRALLTIFAGALIASVVFAVFVFPIRVLRSRKTGGKVEVPLVPFGVFLSPAALVSLLAGDTVIRWYLERLQG